MPSNLAWIDFDEASRRRMLDVIEQFRDQETVDELGLGTIRDAFANYFFPGTSTIMTRARYFLFVPWIYRRVEVKEVPSSRAAGAAREGEFQLIEALIEAGAGENEGVIGRISRRKLQRLPSNIYWVGLHQWRIRLYPGTQDQYHRYLDQYYRKKRNRLVTDDKEPVDGHLDFNWDPHMPDPPENFPRGSTLDLRREDARYLQDKIAQSHGESLLNALINAVSLLQTDYFWEDASLQNELPKALWEVISHARDFALTMHGAVLLYNLMLAQAQGNEGLIDTYRRGIEGWSNAVEARDTELSKWRENLQAFWNCEPLQIGRIPAPTASFVKDWCSLVHGKKDLKQIGEDGAARELIRLRETRLKRRRARLENRRYLELWRGASGVDMLGYRWRQVSRIVRDIREGLGLNGKG